MATPTVFFSYMAIMENSINLISLLKDASPQAIVRVVVRPSIAMGGDEESVEKADPEQFSSPIEYRLEMIARQKRRTQPAKDEVIEKARALGLDAISAGAINAVYVQGEAGQVLDLLQQGNFESAAFD